VLSQVGVELESAVFVVQQEGGSAGVGEGAAEEQVGEDSQGKDVLVRRYLTVGTV
jgi:hypothetical protein